jgi:hypothetical protein
LTNCDYFIFGTIILTVAIILKIYLLRGVFDLSFQKLMFFQVPHSNSFLIGFCRMIETFGIIEFSFIKHAPVSEMVFKFIIVSASYHLLTYKLYKLLIQRKAKL